MKRLSIHQLRIKLLQEFNDRFVALNQDESDEARLELMTDFWKQKLERFCKHLGRDRNKQLWTSDLRDVK